MPDEFPPTTELRGWQERMRAGDEAARNELFRRTCGRLEALTRKMLADFPSVRRWVEAEDVLQSALIRLDRALREVDIISVKAFLGLAARQVRRELLDLARHYYGAEDLGARHDSVGQGAGGAPDRGDDTHNPCALAQWCDLHRQIEALPEEEREVVSLLYYQGLSQAEVAELLGVATKTVQRRWREALVRLHEVLRGGWPGA